MKREGQAPLRGLCELRPLEVSRQPPNLFPSVRHLGSTRQAADQQETRQPKIHGSRGGTGREEGQETPPRRSYETLAAGAGVGGARKASAPPTPRRRFVLGYGSLAGTVSARPRMGCRKAKLIKCYFRSLFALSLMFLAQ